MIRLRDWSARTTIVVCENFSNRKETQVSIKQENKCWLRFSNIVDQCQKIP